MDQNWRVTRFSEGLLDEGMEFGFPDEESALRFIVEQMNEDIADKMFFRYTLDKKSDWTPVPYTIADLAKVC